MRSGADGVRSERSMSEQSAYNKEWNAHDLGCGQLILQLSRKLKDLEGGHVLKLTAYDPGAKEDLPAWCRLTGHTLLKSVHPQYWIQKKG